MKKKIKDLTVGEIEKICKSGIRKGTCFGSKCPLYQFQWLCLGVKNLNKKALESEVETKV